MECPRCKQELVAVVRVKRVPKRKVVKVPEVVVDAT